MMKVLSLKNLWTLKLDLGSFPLKIGFIELFRLGKGGDELEVKSLALDKPQYKS